jgi:hypothetical protein
LRSLSDLPGDFELKKDIYKKAQENDSLTRCCFNKIKFGCTYNEFIEKKIKLILNKM